MPFPFAALVGAGRLEHFREQADFPAEQSAPGQDPWLPSADADARRARHPRRSPPQGARPAVGLSALSVLPAAARLRRRADFTAVTRGGARAGGRAVVVHLELPPDAPGARSQAGFVVSRAVGSAVVRNRVRRRLRHLVRERLTELPAGARLVVRANAGAARASGADLGQQLDAALRTAVDRAAIQRGRGQSQ
jgi:ribonuclease P protein component